MAYNSRLKSEQTDALFEAILTLDTMDDCYRFFEDICTIKEIQAIAQRLEVAKLLKIRKTYSEIEKDTGASTATISRVNRSLQNGAQGYELVLDTLIARNLEEKSKRKQKAGGFLQLGSTCFFSVMALLQWR